MKQKHPSILKAGKEPANVNKTLTPNIILSRQLLILSSFFLLTAFQQEPLKNTSAKYPDTRFMVFSDPHYYDPSLGTEGEAFEAYLRKDRKLLKQSQEILFEAIAKILEDPAEFVLIPGDLTKDGTLVSHKSFAQFLEIIEKSGKQVFVIPGNHDVSNPESYGFRDTLKIMMDNVESGKFREIYADYGYNEALYSDSMSLSYVAEPVEGLWIFAMDACRYEDNNAGGHPVTGGKFKEATLSWIHSMLSLAEKKNKSVIGMMHHGILEHYEKQSHFFEEYVVEDYKKISEMFASKGMKMVFTGHYHAQDVVYKEFKDKSFLFDIETGSLVTFPCPFRSVDIKNNIAEINSYFIESIPSLKDGFREFAEDFVWSGIEGIARETLISYKLQDEEAAMLSGQVADAFVAHYQGDEVSPEKPFILDGISLKGRFLIAFKKKLVWNLYNDLDPADNTLAIDLETGKVL